MVLFVDQSKAFDTVDHNLLLGKLKTSGFSYHDISWIRSYLSDRSQVTRVGNKFSSLKHFSIGVLQGSVLRPLLFNIYVNDLPRCLDTCEIIMYADDTVLYYSSPSVKEIEQHINSDFMKVLDWLTANLLTLFMLVGSSQKLKSCTDVSINIENATLDRVECIKYLGVTINQNMTWADHVGTIVSKSMQRSYRLTQAH